MTAASVAASYRRRLAQVGEAVTLKRGATTLAVQGYVMPAGGSDPIEGGVTQRTRTLLVLAADVTLDGGVKKGDRAAYGGRDYLIENVAERRPFGAIVAYELTVKG